MDANGGINVSLTEVENRRDDKDFGVLLSYGGALLSKGGVFCQMKVNYG